MPLLQGDLDQIALPQSHYGYSATRMNQLGATEYTLATIVCDASGSVASFRSEMEAAVKKIIEACKFSPRADNLMVRLVIFDDSLTEIHGFKLLENCNISDYDNVIRVGGTTALFDASENAISATVSYGNQLSQNQFSSNAIVFVITDGGDNASKFSAKNVKNVLAKAVSDEALESIVSILIGVNTSASGISQYLQDFNKEAGFTQYIDIAHADAKTLAKLAEFVSKSISAQSQSLGSGGPSQSLTF